MERVAKAIIKLFDSASHEPTDMHRLAFWVNYLAPAQVKYNLLDFCESFIKENKGKEYNK